MVNVVVEISSRTFTESIALIDDPGFGTSVASGLGGEQLLRVWMGSLENLERLLKVVLEVIDRDRITGLKISIDGRIIEASSIRTRDIPYLKDLVHDAVSNLKRDS